MKTKNVKKILAIIVILFLFIFDNYCIAFDYSKPYESNKNYCFSVEDTNSTEVNNLYFNDKSLFVADRNLTKNAFEDTIIAESGELGERDISGNVIGESDSFLETTKENFKSSIKLEAKYCINNKCKTEPFNIEYLD